MPRNLKSSWVPAFDRKRIYQDEESRAMASIIRDMGREVEKITKKYKFRNRPLNLESIPRFEKVFPKIKWP